MNANNSIALANAARIAAVTTSLFKVMGLAPVTPKEASRVVPAGKTYVGFYRRFVQVAGKTHYIDFAHFVALFEALLNRRGRLMQRWTKLHHINSWVGTYVNHLRLHEDPEAEVVFLLGSCAMKVYSQDGIGWSEGQAKVLENFLSEPPKANTSCASPQALLNRLDTGRRKRTVPGKKYHTKRVAPHPAAKADAKKGKGGKKQDRKAQQRQAA